MDDLLSVFMEHVCACVDFYCLYFGWRLPLETKCSRSAIFLFFFKSIGIAVDVKRDECQLLSSGVFHAQERRGSESDTYTDGVCVLLRRKMHKARRASCPALDLSPVQPGTACRHRNRRTLRASISGTFPQTRPYLVTTLKGSGTNMTVEATQRQSTYVNIRRIHPG